MLIIYRYKSYKRPFTYIYAHTCNLVTLKIKLEKMREKIIETKLANKIKKLGGWALKFYCLSFTGMPDRIVLMPGARIFFVELKAPGKSVKKGSRQDIVQRQLREWGFDVWVVNNMEALDQFLFVVESC